MPLKSYDEFIKRISDGYWMQQPIWGEIATTTTGTFLANNQFSIQKIGFTKNLPTLPSGVTNYICTRMFIACSVFDVGFLFAKIIDFGNLNIAGPTFTNGVAMPTVTELGASNQIASAVLVEVTTALNATPGSLQITYVDQDGNTAEANTAQAMTASSVKNSVGWAILNGTDWGVRDITGATRTGGTSPTGVVQFWGLIPLAFMGTGQTSAGITPVENLLTSGFNPVRLGGGDVLAGFCTSSTSVRGLFGSLYFVGDN